MRISQSELNTMLRDAARAVILLDRVANRLYRIAPGGVLHGQACLAASLPPRLCDALRAAGAVHDVGDELLYDLLTESEVTQCHTH